MTKTTRTPKKTAHFGKAAAEPPVTDGATDAPKSGIDRLETMKIGQLQALYAEVVGKPTRSPNRTFLVRSIMETAVAAETAPTVKPSPESSAADDTAVSTLADATSDLPAAGTKLSKLDVPALQALYQEVLGRPTSSTARNYLVWKIREAQKGRVPLGPRESRRRESESIKVLPLRLESDLVDQLDAVWRRQGLQSRMQLFRVSLRAYLTSVGEGELAERICATET